MRLARLEVVSHIDTLLCNILPLEMQAVCSGLAVR